MKYLNALNRIEGVGPKRMQKLMSFFYSPEKAWEAGLSHLIASGIGEKISERIVSERNNINPDEEWEKLQKENIKMLSMDNPEYPRLLKEIPSPPYIIYAKGSIDYNSRPMIAIVGSRKYTSYGSQAAVSLSKNLALAGITIVSGMALGIDAIAHRAALDAGGETIAVLGNSLEDNFIYPRVNIGLSREIIAQGALVSEYPLGTSAGALTFPARNRIVAGMALGTLIIEAGEESGALITAAAALEYNREVFSVPGSIFSSQSIGTNELIKKGAKLVLGIKDILDELNLESTLNKISAAPKIPENENERILLSILSIEPLHVDNIAKLSKLDTSAVSGTLVIMEMKGWIKNIGGQNYIIL